MALRGFQRQVKAFDKRKGWVDDRPEDAVLHMQEELGEISRNILKRTGYKRGKYRTSDMEDELTDLLYLTFKLGNILELDLDKGWARIGKRYKRK
jgi:NTP pyrophosphatase (non-canonical NTP hydrolase)